MKEREEYFIFVQGAIDMERCTNIHVIGAFSLLFSQTLKIIIIQISLFDIKRHMYTYSRSSPNLSLNDCVRFSFAASLLSKLASSSGENSLILSRRTAFSRERDRPLLIFSMFFENSSVPNMEPSRSSSQEALINEYVIP